MKQPTDIVLATANARYSHCAFGLKRLWCALGSLRDRACVVEFTIQQQAKHIVAAVLAYNPRIVGLGVYIWNVELLTEVVTGLRRAAPNIVVVIGGPELLDCNASMPIVAAANYIVMGEGEIAFAALVRQLLAGHVPKDKLIEATPPDLEMLPDPYDTYSDTDIGQRVLYVESSRGCPYRCAFCLSSRDNRVRYFPLDAFLDRMGMLLARGARRFKFTDRTFNVNDDRVLAILTYFLQQPYPDMQLHFEIMPDRLSTVMLKKMADFPPEGLHLELGIQSVSQETQQRIHRNQHIPRSMEAITFLRKNTGASLHADLIVGLPGDTQDDIARGFNMLVDAGIHEIQIGILKRLRGTAIADELKNGWAFNDKPPYEVLHTPAFSPEDIQWFQRFSRYFDRYYNRKNFPDSLALLWETEATPFDAFAGLTNWVWAREQKTHHLSLVRLAEHLYQYLVAQQHREPKGIGQTIESDFRSVRGRKDKLKFLIDK